MQSYLSQQPLSFPSQDGVHRLYQALQLLPAAIRLPLALAPSPGDFRADIPWPAGTRQLDGSPASCFLTSSPPASTLPMYPLLPARQQGEEARRAHGIPSLRCCRYPAHVSSCEVTCAFHPSTWHVSRGLPGCRRCWRACGRSQEGTSRGRGVKYWSRESLALSQVNRQRAEESEITFFVLLLFQHFNC